MRRGFRIHYEQRCKCAGIKQERSSDPGGQSITSTQFRNHAAHGEPQEQWELMLLVDRGIGEEESECRKVLANLKVTEERWWILTDKDRHRTRDGPK